MEIISKLLVLCLIALTSAICPNQEIVSPCKCQDNSISCADIHTELDLKKLFENINNNTASNQKNWGSFHLENTNVRELPANVFGEISFEQVHLIDNQYLSYIHPLALTRSSFRLKTFNSQNNPLSNYGDKERDIFDALSRLTDLRLLRLYRTNLTSIPDNAFHPINGEFTKLTWISTEESPIKTIGEFAFYHMPNLERLLMTRNKFTQIKRNTFTIKEHSDKKSEIFLQGVPLSDTSFDALSLIRIRRPLGIRLFQNNITVLYESVFAPFLELHPENYVDLSGNDIICDCRNKWILDEPNYYNTKVWSFGNGWGCKIDGC